MTRQRRAELLWSALVLSLCAAAVIASAPAQYLGRQQDDLLYLIGARALLEGRFRLLTVPGQPPLYMIGVGFPVLLAPLSWLAGERWGVYQAFCALLLAAAPALILPLLRRRGVSLPAALLICALFATSPLVLSQAGTIMSEAPFLLAALGLLLAIERRAAKASSVLLLFATQLRTAAVCLLPPALVEALARRRWRDAAVVAAPALAGLAAFSLWSRLVAGAAQQKLEELGVAYAAGIAALPGAAWRNAAYFLSSWGGCFAPARWAAAAPALGLVLLALSARGALRLRRRDRSEPVVWLLGAAALLHLAWPWHYERYLIMPLPFALWCLAEGLGRRARPALAVLLAAQLVFQSRPWLSHQTGWDRPELAETYAWLRAGPEPGRALSSIMYVRDGFYAGRPALPIPPDPDPASFSERLKSRRAGLVLWQDGLDLGLTLGAASPVSALLDRARRNLDDAARFRLIYENPREHARVYQVL